MSSRLTADDWVETAYEAMMTEGPEAVAVQPLTRQLGATKGSFYWHFDTRDDLLRAALERWLQVAIEEPVAEIEAQAAEWEVEPTALARRLLARTSTSLQANPGQLRMLASDHPDVAEAVAQAAERRVAAIAALLRAAGFARGLASRRAALAYATFLGYANLAYVSPEVLPRSTAGERAFDDEMLRVLVGPEW